jgi:hypothetical protein
MWPVRIRLKLNTRGQVGARVEKRAIHFNHCSVSLDVVHWGVVSLIEEDALKCTDKT